MDQFYGDVLSIVKEICAVAEPTIVKISEMMKYRGHPRQCHFLTSKR